MDPEKGSPSKNSADHQQEPEIDPHQPISIPPWVQAQNDTESSLLPADAIVPNTRHWRPSAASHQHHHLHPPQLNHKKGRRWDHLRSDEPALLSGHITKHQTRWMGFMASSPMPHTDASRVVDDKWMEENMPLDWHDELADKEGAERSTLLAKGWWLLSPEGQEKTVRLFWNILLKNPFVPLVFRLTIFAFAAAALGLGASIMSTIRTDYGRTKCAVRASTYMAIVVDTVALPYIGYVTWDEYFSKPLGLRSAAAKMLLLLCDLFFIIFASSNTSLAFNALTDPRWACYDRDDSVFMTCPKNNKICGKQTSLSAVLLVGLFFWGVTFCLSVLRVVERLRV